MKRALSISSTSFSGFGVPCHGPAAFLVPAQRFCQQLYFFRTLLLSPHSASGDVEAQFTVETVVREGRVPIFHFEGWLWKCNSQ